MRADWAARADPDGRCALGAVARPPRRSGSGASACRDPSGRIEGAGAAAGDSASGDPPRIAVSRSHTPSWTQRFADSLGARLVHAGSVGNKVGLLLLGQADLYVHRKMLKEWDTCAPEVVARALGWTVCRLRGEEHPYNRPDPRNDELVARRLAWKERVLPLTPAARRGIDRGIPALEEVRSRERRNLVEAVSVARRDPARP